MGLSGLAYNNHFTLLTSIDSSINIHPGIMIFGVIAGLLISEKLEFMESAKIFNRFRISRIIIATLYPGIFLISYGITSNLNNVRIAGSILIAISALLFFYFVIGPYSHGYSLIKLISGVSVISLALLAILNDLKIITGSTSMAVLALSFPIYYIIGEI